MKKETKMTNDQFDDLINDSDAIYSEYMEYIQENADMEWPICNGDDLIEAAEAGFLYEDFRDDWIEKNCVH